MKPMWKHDEVLAYLNMKPEALRILMRAGERHGVKPAWVNVGGARNGARYRWWPDQVDQWLIAVCAERAAAAERTAHPHRREAAPFGVEPGPGYLRRLHQAREKAR